MNIEKPTLNQNYIKPDEKIVNLSGWAVSDDSNVTFRILIDGKISNSKVVRTVRNDVNKSISGQYGGVSATPKAGFYSNVDISNLSEGNHTIKVCQISRYGLVICENERNIIISNKKYIRKNAYRKACRKSEIYQTR